MPFGQGINGADLRRSELASVRFIYGATRFLLVSGAAYSWGVYGQRDWRVLLVPFVNAAQFVVFVFCALTGLAIGRQSFHAR